MHTVHVLTNNADNAYFMVLNERKSLEAIENECLVPNEHFARKNGQRVRFVTENHGDLTLEQFDAGVLETFDEVIAFRDALISRYHANGFVIVDEKHFKIMDQDANTNFDAVLSRIDITKAVKKFGTDVLLAARKTLTVGEFIEKFAV